MANDVVIRVKADDQASRVLGNVEQKASGLGRAFSEVGKVAGGFLAANVIAGAGQKIIGFFDSTIQKASDLEQAIGGTEAVFGDASSTITRFAETAAQDVGLSERAFRELTTGVGGQLKRMTGDVDLAKDSSIDLTRVAADLAATYGGTATEAMEAFGSALRGEADPAERFNLNLKASVVNAKAVELGLAETTSSVDENAKAQAILALITEQSADAQGQFAEESDTAAGKAAIEQAKMENLQATLGEKLLPVQVAVTKAKIALVDALVTHVIPALEKLYREHWPAVSAAIQDVVAIVEEWWPKLKPIFETIATDVATRVEGMIGVITSIVENVQNVIDLVSALASGDWSRAWDELKEIGSTAVEGFVSYFKTQFGLLGGLARSALNEVIDAINSVIRAWNDLSFNVSGPFGIGDISVGTPNLPTIPRLAQGGVVTKPTLAMIGEGGPEAVVPLDRRMDFGGVHVHGNVYIDDSRKDTGPIGDMAWSVMAAMQARGVAL